MMVEIYQRSKHYEFDRQIAKTGVGVNISSIADNIQSTIIQTDVLTQLTKG
jgi:hypothetical protein